LQSVAAIGLATGARQDLVHWDRRHRLYRRPSELNANTEPRIETWRAHIGLAGIEREW
jgi:hypothetical protein